MPRLRRCCRHSVEMRAGRIELAMLTGRMKLCRAACLMCLSCQGTQHLSDSDYLLAESAIAQLSEL